MSKDNLQIRITTFFNPPMNLNTPIHNTLQAGEVVRYHAVPTVKPQNIAHHSWNVAIIALYLWPDLPRKLLVELIAHDVDEYWTGDIPYTVKRDNPEIKEMFHDLAILARRNTTLPADATDYQEEAILKIADTLDGFIWCAMNERNGPVEGRWHEAYHRARVKFWVDVMEIHPDIWERADNLFRSYGGVL
jgi:5'-deoxynucleotidase YfbR-like HD superfamily hydrolase